MVFYAFDVLYIDGFDIRSCTLLDRKRVLSLLLKNAKPPLMYSEHLETDGPQMYRDACQMKLEGVVSKLATGKYQSGRSPNWTKVTCRKRDTFVVAGIAYKGSKFDGLYLGREEEGALTYAGKVENGISTAQQRDIINRAKTLLTPRQALKPPVKKPKAKWLKPRLKVDVEYRALTGEGKLRHPSFKGVREDL
jgi:bifunctional non-homologous end joining protein LigD